MKTITIDGTEYTLTPVEPPKPARLEFPVAGYSPDALEGSKLCFSEYAMKTAHCFRTESAAKIAKERRLSCMRQIQAGLEADPDAGGFIKGVREWTVYYSHMDCAWAATTCVSVASSPIYVHTFEQAEAARELLNREGVKP